MFLLLVFRSKDLLPPHFVDSNLRICRNFPAWNHIVILTLLIKHEKFLFFCSILSNLKALTDCLKKAQFVAGWRYHADCLTPDREFSFPVNVEITLSVLILARLASRKLFLQEKFK